MPIEIKKRIERSPIVVIMPNGDRMVSYQEITTINDWRKTIVGPVNFGHVIFGPTRYVMEREDNA